MKAWIVLLVLGAVVLATGVVMRILRWHPTIGLGGLGLGAVIIVAGLVAAFLGKKKKVGVEHPQVQVPP